MPAARRDRRTEGAGADRMHSRPPRLAAFLASRILLGVTLKRAFAAKPAEHLAIRLTPVGRVTPSSTIRAAGSRWGLRSRCRGRPLHTTAPAGGVFMSRIHGAYLGDGIRVTPCRAPCNPPDSVGRVTPSSAAGTVGPSGGLRLRCRGRPPCAIAPSGGVCSSRIGDLRCVHSRRNLPSTSRSAWLRWQGVCIIRELLGLLNTVTQTIM